MQWLFWKMWDSWVVYSMTQSRWNLCRFYGNLGTNSLSTIHKSYAPSCKHQRKQRSVARKNPNEWILPAPSVIKPEERKILADYARQCTCWAGKTWTLPTTVVAANGEVQTKEEATVNVKNCSFATVKLLEHTQAVLALGKHCQDHGYSYEWTSGQKPQLIKDGRRIEFNPELRTNHCP